MGHGFHSYVEFIAGYWDNWNSNQETWGYFQISSFTDRGQILKLKEIYIYIYSLYLYIVSMYKFPDWSWLVCCRDFFRALVFSTHCVNAGAEVTPALGILDLVQMIIALGFIIWSRPEDFGACQNDPKWRWTLEILSSKMLSISTIKVSTSIWVLRLNSRLARTCWSRTKSMDEPPSDFVQNGWPGLQLSCDQALAFAVLHPIFRTKFCWLALIS